MIDLEVAHSTPSPTVDPSVHVLLVGHSMGGIVGTETLLLLANEQPIPPPTSSRSNHEAPNFPSNTTLNSATSTSRPNPIIDPKETPTEGATLMFPHVQGLLAFDTPFLGIAPGVIAHGAEGHYKTATSAYGAFSEIASGFGWGSKSEPGTGSSTPKRSGGALPAPPVDAAAAPKWQSWGKYAMFAGAAGAVAAGGAAALYSQKDRLSAGWGWAWGHLEFVKCLSRIEDLKKRVDAVSIIMRDRHVGSANFYTCLGKGATQEYGVVAATEVMKQGSSDRTFCMLPRKVRESQGKQQQSSTGLQWYKAVNDKATDETLAHMSFFFPKDNPGFYTLGQKARDTVVSWIDQGWYNSSEERPAGEFGGRTHGELGGGWEKPDYNSKDVKAKRRQKSFSQDWEGLDGVDDPRYADNDVEMRDEVNDNVRENLEDSIIVDHAEPKKTTST